MYKSDSDDGKQERTVTSAHLPTTLVATGEDDLPPSSFQHTADGSDDAGVVGGSNRDKQSAPSLAAVQLSGAVMQIFEPSILHIKGLVKELIGKQNKIYVDLSAEKFKLDNSEMVKLNEMMNNVKMYREKLIRIKKQMQNIYQRTKVLKKRAASIEAYKQKELQRKLQKQQQEKALIGKQQQQQQQPSEQQQHQC